MQKVMKAFFQQYIKSFSTLVAVWALCIAWPLYQVLSEGATFFAAHNAGRIEILLFVLVVSFAFPLIWSLIIALTGLFSRWARNAFFAVGIAVPLGLFLARAFIYKPWSWLPDWGVWVLGVVLLSFTMVISSLLTRLRLTWKESMAGLAVALLVVGLFMFSPSMAGFIFPQSSHLFNNTKIDKAHEKQPNIVVIVFDELSLIDMLNAEGQINDRLFPNFAKLSKESIWFPNASAYSLGTERSVTAIYTGSATPAKFLPTAKQYPLNLYSILSQNHRVYNFESLTNFGGKHQFNQKIFINDCWVVFCRTFFSDVVNSYIGTPKIGAKWDSFGDESLVINEKRGMQINKILNLLKKNKHDLKDRPYAIIAHLEIPHVPYEYSYNGARHNFPYDINYYSEMDRLRESNFQFASSIHYLAYLQQLAYVDKILGEILDSINFTNTVLFVTADHGVSYIPNESRRGSIPYCLSIPFFVKGPGVSPHTSYEYVTNADILTSILDLLGYEPEAHLIGYSIFSKNYPRKRLLQPYNIKPIKPEVFSQKIEKALTTIEKQLMINKNTTIDRLICEDREFDIVGKKISEFDIAEEAKYSIKFKTQIQDFIRINKKKYLPLFIDFEISSDIDLPIAVAVNGIICSINRTYKDQIRTSSNISQFIGYIPPAALVDGYNKVELFVPIKRGDQILLSPIKFKYPTAHLNGAKTIEYYNKKISIVQNELIEGYAGDGSEFDNSILTLNGWAIDKKRVAGVDEVLLFIGDDAVGFSGSPKPRADVVDYFKEPRYANSGFSLVIPNISHNELLAARLFAISGQIAKELPLPAELFTKQVTDKDNISFSKDGILNWQGKKYFPCSTNGEIEGFIDINKWDRKQLVVGGWAIDFVNKKPVDTIVVFVNNEPKVWQVPYVPRPDVVKVFNNESYQRTGFNIQVPASSIKAAKNVTAADVKVYALSSGRYLLLQNAGGN